MNITRPGPPSVFLSDIQKFSKNYHESGSKVHSMELSSRISASPSIILDSLIAYGYAIISVDPLSARTIQSAYDTLLKFNSSIPIKEKKKCFKKFDGDRYIGFAGDAMREWLQMRVTYDKDGNSSVPFPWPESFLLTDRDSLTNAAKLLTKSAEEIFEEIGLLLNIGDRTYLQSLCRGNKNKKCDENSDEIKENNMLGSSVCRQFVYIDRPIPNHTKNTKNIQKENISEKEASDKERGVDDIKKDKKKTENILQHNFSMPLASTLHADMGLLTLSPCSTIPALTLVHPHTHTILFPERDLGSNEWILFAGETFSFLTQGLVQAPLHAVPYVDRKKMQMKINENTNNSTDTFGETNVQPFRRSMPLFLRADPDMILHHRSRKECSSSYISSSVRTSESNGKFPFTLSSISNAQLPRKEEQKERKEDEREVKGVERGREGEKEKESNGEKEEEKDGRQINEITLSTDMEEGLEVRLAMNGRNEEDDSGKILAIKENEKKKEKEKVNEKKKEKEWDSPTAAVEEEEEEEEKEEEKEEVKGVEENKVIKEEVAAVTVSVTGMTCREYMVDHLIGLRPWRLGKGLADF